MDNEKATDVPADYERMMCEVICGDAELFYLDVCLRETLGGAAN